MDDTNQDIPATENSQVSQRLNLESLINRYVGDLEKLKEQMKTQKSMLEDSFNNNPEYSEAAEKAKETNRAKNVIKQKIIKDPAIEHVNEEVKRIKEDIKDAKDALSSYLQQYYQSVGATQIIGDDGETREIVVVTKLVKKSSKYRP